ncbi:asparaginase [Pseudonocardiaceae bacterium YIM PH 21723]|nr:asparaginase [Pseudonocardiaceae bacterium YIM PH 21723]
MNAPLVELVRSGFREGVHYGSAVVLNPDGSVRRAIGSPDEPMFPRSSNKPLQALGMLRAGLELPDNADLALACASHSGDPGHIARALAILERHRLTEHDLHCPEDLPLGAAERDAYLAEGLKPRRAVMNCSGKHAAMLATCVQQGWPVDSYLDPAHPLQQTISATIAEVVGEPLALESTDGCGAPLAGFSLTGLARAFLRISQATDPLLGRIGGAMRTYPHLVAGTDREDTLLMRAVPGLVSKIGAEGVGACALPDGGAVALKISDGNGRARPPILVAGLRALGVKDSPALAKLAESPVLGGGQPVGTLRVIPGLFD